MKSLFWVTFLPQAALSGCAVVLSIWIRLPWAVIICMGILSAEIISISRRGKISKLGLIFAWGCTLGTVGSLLFSKGGIENQNFNYVLPGCLNAAAILLASLQLTDARMKGQLRMLAMVWGYSAGFICLEFSYSQNLFGLFHVGLLINLTLLVFNRFLFKLPALTIITVNTLILLLITLPIIDLCVRPHYRPEPDPDPHKKYFLYENAKTNPGGRDAWLAAYDKQMHAFNRHSFLWHGMGTDPIWELKPNARTLLFQSLISINSRGFRGKEFSEEKGDAYRIVALGESTTFDITFCAEDKPWPEMLEQMIRERIHPQQPVEVINAGVPGYHLKHNLDRLPGQILALNPDMIISYHGYNGFPFINKALPMSIALDMPVYRDRPLKLCAECEYRTKLILYRQREIAKVAQQSSPPSDPMDTEYAALYRRLIEATQTNGIQLVLANYAMAVDAHSDLHVIEFYRPMFPLVYWQIKANETHSTIISNLVRQHPEICFVDIRSKLDGHDRNFVDLMHFSPEGRQKVAETMFTGIENILMNKLDSDNSATNFSKAAY